jgi:hypothetical protein
MTVMMGSKAAGRVSVADMRRHVERLCEQHEIQWWQDQTRSDRAHSFNEFIYEIHTAPVRGPVSYGTAMHEVGHLLGRYRKSRRVIVREEAAWLWAQAHALVWTPAMERHARRRLDWYRRNAARIDRERASWSTIEEQLAETPAEIGAGAADAG